MVSVGEQRESADWLRLPCDSGLTCPVFSQVGFIACVREGAVGSWYKDQTVKGMGTGTCWEGSHQVRPHQYKRHAKQVDVRDTVPWSEMRASFYSNFGLAHADVCTMWKSRRWATTCTMSVDTTTFFGAGPTCFMLGLWAQLFDSYLPVTNGKNATAE